MPDGDAGLLGGGDQLSAPAGSTLGYPMGVDEPRDQVDSDPEGCGLPASVAQGTCATGPGDAADLREHGFRVTLPPGFESERVE